MARRKVRNGFARPMAWTCRRATIRQSRAGSAPVNAATLRHARGHPPTQQAVIPVNFASDVREIRQLAERLGGADERKEVIGQLSGLIGRYGAGGLGELIDAIS
jgi:hypothetical protein